MKRRGHSGDVPRASAHRLFFPPQTVCIFVQVRTTCRRYFTPANYRADPESCSFIPPASFCAPHTHLLPPPFSETNPEETIVMHVCDASEPSCFHYFVIDQVPPHLPKGEAALLVTLRTFGHSCNSSVITIIPLLFLLFPIQSHFQRSFFFQVSVYWVPAVLALLSKLIC